jgi:hypothetical protein
MGQPGRVYTLSFITQYIGNESERGELKHLSTRRNRNQFRDSVSSGERTRNSPNHAGLPVWGCRSPMWDQRYITEQYGKADHRR